MQAVITGASSGIGRDMAVSLSNQGYDLILVARRRERLEELKLPTRVKIFCYDLSKPEQVMAFYHEIEKENIQVFINNAGYGVFGTFLENSLEDELGMLSTNVTAVHILTKLILQKFDEQNYGYLLNVASSAAFYPGPMLAAYYATKAYVYRLTLGIYEELRRKKSKVSVSVLCPGPVKTEFDRVANVKFSLKGLESGFVADYALKKMFRKKTVIIPGVSMKMGKFFSRFLPEKLLIRILYYLQKKKS
ncbi:MAG: SDR family oxidoreductase [Clostridia bacterium]|nr:SDR family oxidoreductase [Clostridia bacterium]